MIGHDNHLLCSVSTHASFLSSMSYSPADEPLPTAVLYQHKYHVNENTTNNRNTRTQNIRQSTAERCFLSSAFLNVAASVLD